MNEVEVILKNDYIKLLAAARELEVIKTNARTDNDEIQFACQRAIYRYCNQHPEIIEFYREKDDEDEQDIINDLWFDDIIVFEMETQKE